MLRRTSNFDASTCSTVVYSFLLRTVL